MDKNVTKDQLTKRLKAAEAKIAAYESTPKQIKSESKSPMPNRQSIVELANGEISKQNEVYHLLYELSSAVNKIVPVRLVSTDTGSGKISDEKGKTPDVFDTLEVVSNLSQGNINIIRNFL